MLSRTTAYAAKRLLVIPFSILVVISLSFWLINILPGDVALQIAGGFATEERVDEVRGELGLDQPLGERYVDYIGDTLRGDLGESYFTGESVRTEILDRLPSSLELVVPALLFAGLFGFALGSISAYYRGRGVDRVAKGTISLVQSIPDFLLALVLIYVVFFLLGWAPSPVGRFALRERPPPSVTHFFIIDAFIARDWGLLWSILTHMLLPVSALGIVYSVYFGRTARAALSPALQSPQVEFARACGLRERKVFGYAVLAARTPILTYAAILFGALVGGAAIVETIFSWRGLGQWALEGMLKLDLPVIQGFILVVGVSTLLIYLALDLLILYLDPRISH
jgi:ABC-type dipeptide/oligopeptide/nickel transport system permease component